MHPAPEPAASLNSVHATARVCRASPAAALALLSTAAGLARWNLGLWHTQEVAPGLLTGQSLFGGGTGYARIRVDARPGLGASGTGGIVSYAISEDRDGPWVERIQAQVQSSAALGHGEGGCVVSLLAWRMADMDPARWQRLVSCHEVEIEIIRSVLEADARSKASNAPSDKTQSAPTRAKRRS